MKRVQLNLWVSEASAAAFREFCTRTSFNQGKAMDEVISTFLKVVETNSCQICERPIKFSTPKCICGTCFDTARNNYLKD